jgi:hypothetical protein
MSEEQFPAYEIPDASVNTSPRPFGEIPGLWLKITQMTEQFFAQEAPRASGSNTLISVVILAVLSAVLSALSSLIGGGIQSALLPSEYRDMAATGVGGSIVCSLCSGLIGTALGFYIGNGLTYLGARVFGGDGDFGTQLYLQSLFAVPIGIVSGVVGLVPIVGALAILAASVYAFVLNVRLFKAIHNLTTGKAVLSIILPGLVIAIVVGCVMVVILALLGPTIGNVFSDIVNDLQ